MKDYRSLMRASVFALTATMLAGGAAQGQTVSSTPVPQAAPARPTVVDGVANVPSFQMPFSKLASPEARKEFTDLHANSANSPMAKLRGMSMADQRATLDKFYFGPKIVRARQVYDVDIKPWQVGSVYTEVVTPKVGVSAANRRRVLINLHGGGFTTGARTNGQLESIPIAATGNFRVVTVDYRQGPENRFPAASEDVATVYRELLKTYKPENIGIFGCSAGGALTAMSTAWLQAQRLPKPGAIGIFCAGAGRRGDGDSSYFSAIANGQTPPPASGEAPMRGGYFEGADMSDAMLSPVDHPDVMRKFPPTLLITATRDPAMSGIFYTQRQLVNAGVDTELHVWDGLAHYFFANVDLPESREAYGVISRFFDKRLGR